jgi:CRISPR/Cas system-associated protein Csm6
MAKKIITTVGTSIFTNYRDEKVKARLGRDYASIDVPMQRTLAKRDGSEVPATDIYADEYQSYIKTLKEIIRDFWYEYPEIDQPNQNASAEIASILKIIEAENEPCEVHLIATDTLQSVLAAELIVGWFEKYRNPKVSKVLFQRQDTLFEKQGDSEYVVKDLRVKSQVDYETGFMNLIELLEKIHIKDHTILNITGGYKGIIPVATLFGQLFEIPLYYLYNEEETEKQENAITIGNLPIHFDLGYIENFVLYLQSPDQIPDNTIAKKMYELGLIAKSNIPIYQGDLTIIGKLIKNKQESFDLPFQKTTLGYLVELKLYEYYSRNIIEGYNLTLGYRLNAGSDNDLDDVDLWFESDEDVIAAEVKSATIEEKKMRKKLRELIRATSVYIKPLKEIWIILYEFENAPATDFEKWRNKVFNADFTQNYNHIPFKVKKISIGKNVIDGKRNRMNYQEFMRSKIDKVDEV